MKLRAGTSAALLVLLAACASPPREETPAPPPNELPMPADPAGRVPARSPKQIVAGIVELADKIGSYPPQVSSELERQSLYERWSDLLLDARALQWTSETEAQRLAILGELYRLGHNLDVTGAGELADQTLLQCLDLHPRAIPCNWSIVSFYLSVTPSEERLKQVNWSLNVLREELGPAPNEKVENDFVVLRLFQNDPKAAQRQIDVYLQKFPNGPRAEAMRKLRAELDDPEALQPKSAP